MLFLVSPHRAVTSHQIDYFSPRSSTQPTSGSQTLHFFSWSTIYLETDDTTIFYLSSAAPLDTLHLYKFHEVTFSRWRGPLSSTLYIWSLLILNGFSFLTISVSIYVHSWISIVTFDHVWWIDPKFWDLSNAIQNRWGPPFVSILFTLFRSLPYSN